MAPSQSDRERREEICEKMKQDDNFETVFPNLRTEAERVEAAANGRTWGRTRPWNALISPLL